MLNRGQGEPCRKRWADLDSDDEQAPEEEVA